ncbi:MAG: hypothetical protein M3Q19_09675 [Pseudomonadota bacterium]|nr:hypothetical protein [Pseudomonadota bacterium]
MKRSSRNVIWVVVAVAFAAPVVAFPFLDRIVPVLGPVLPRHEGVPDSATANYDFKEGVFWTWQRPLGSGCAKWMAMDRFASVRLLHGAKGCADGGKIVDYDSFAEEIVFNAGGGDSPNGTWLGGNPCPYRVPASEIRALAELARDARKASQTEPEKAILLQVQNRLAKVDGSDLTTDHRGGCNDLKVADYSGPLRPHLDVWNLTS